MKVGDIVALASGGPPMSVVAVNDDLVTCAWFEYRAGPEGSGGWTKCERATFPEAVLTEASALDTEH